MANELVYITAYPVTTARINRRLPSGVEQTMRADGSWVAITDISAEDYESDGVVSLSAGTHFAADVQVYVGSMPSGVEAGIIEAPAFVGDPVKGEQVAFPVTNPILWTGTQALNPADINTLSSLVSSLQSQIAQIQDDLAAQPQPQTTVTSSGDYATDLLTIRNNLQVKLLEASANPKPNYSIDGQSVSWADYMRMLQEQLEKTNMMLAANSPVEVVTEAFP